MLPCFCVRALFLAGSALGLLLPQGENSTDADEPMEQALSWMRQAHDWTERFEYLTGGEVRLLIVWSGEDHVGRGYIRLGKIQNLETVSLLFGSVPEKAPLDLNRWGAATETLKRDPESGAPVASGFLGFRKSSADVEAAQSRPGNETEGESNGSTFEASLNYVGKEEATAHVLLLDPGERLGIGAMERVRQRALERFGKGKFDVKRLSSGERTCPNVPGFLFTVKALLDDVASAPRERPPSRCYIYNAQEYTVSVQDVETIDSHEVELELDSGETLTRRYRDLVEVELETINHETRNETQFTVTIGTREPLKGVPVEILYQPSMWVRVKIQLRDSET